MSLVDPVILRPGEGEQHAMGPTSVVVKAGSDETGGSFYLGEATIAPGFRGPPPHTHEKLHDMFFVLEGTLTLRIGDETVSADAGTFVCVPPGNVHTFSNTSDAPVRFLNFNTPGGWGELHARARRSVVRWQAADDRGDRQDRVPLRLPPLLSRTSAAR